MHKNKKVRISTSLLRTQNVLAVDSSFCTSPDVYCMFGSSMYSVGPRKKIKHAAFAPKNIMEGMEEL